MPEVSLPIALAGCFATCSAYAALLTTEQGKRVTLDHTWATVVVGVGVVLAWIATQGAHDWTVDLMFFAAGGTPMVARSFWLYWRNQRSYIAYLRDRRDGE